MNPRRIDKNQLRSRAMQNAEDTVAGCLGLFGGNGDFLIENSV